MDWENVLTSLIVAATVIAVVALPVRCTERRQEAVVEAVVEAVKAGADPILAKCAMGSDSSTNPVCVVRAAAK